MFVPPETQTTTLRQRLHAFLDGRVWTSEDPTANGRRASAAHHVDRSLAFIGISMADYERAASAWDAANRALLEGAEAGPVSPEHWARLQAHAHLSHEVHLRIETFYVNARVLMDALVVLVDELKRPCAVMIGGHSNLKRRLPDVAAEGCLSEPPPQLCALIDQVTMRIKDFRDDHVSHVREARYMKGTRFNTQDSLSARIGIFTAFPHSEGTFESELPSELWPLIEQYVDTWIEYLVVSLDARKPA